MNHDSSHTNCLNIFGGLVPLRLLDWRPFFGISRIHEFKMFFFSESWVGMMSWSLGVPLFLATFCFFGCQGPAYWIQMMTKWHAFKACHGRSERFLFPKPFVVTWEILRWKIPSGIISCSFIFVKYKILTTPTTKAHKEKNHRLSAAPAPLQSWKARYCDGQATWWKHLISSE